MVPGIDVEVVVDPCIRLGEGSGLLPPVCEIAERNAGAFAISLRINANKLFRISIRKGRNQRGVDNAEYGGVGADAEGDGKQNGNDQASVGSPLPKGMHDLHGFLINRGARFLEGILAGEFHGREFFVAVVKGLGVAGVFD